MEKTDGFDDVFNSCVMAFGGEPSIKGASFARRIYEHFPEIGPIETDVEILEAFLGLSVTIYFEKYGEAVGLAKIAQTIKQVSDGLRRLNQ